MKRDPSMETALPLNKTHSRFYRAFSGLGRDVGYAWRMMIKTKGFTVTVLSTLALCIGANTAIYSMLDTLVFKPLPFPESDRIVSVYTHDQDDDPDDRHGSNIPQYLDFKDNVDAFEHLAVWQAQEFNLVLGDDAYRYSGAAATSEIFDVFGLDLSLRSHL